MATTFSRKPMQRPDRQGPDCFQPGHRRENERLESDPTSADGGAALARRKRETAPERDCRESAAPLAG